MIKEMIKTVFENWQAFLNHYTYEQWERFILWCICVGGIYWRVHFRENRELITGFKGENGFWEAPEAIIYAWFWLFPILLCSSYFFQWPISDQIWSFLELILYVALGLRGVMETAKLIKNPVKAEETKKE